MTTIAAHLPPGSQLVLAARTEPGAADRPAARPPRGSTSWARRDLVMTKGECDELLAGPRPRPHPRAARDAGRADRGLARGALPRRAGAARARPSSARRSTASPATTGSSSTTSSDEFLEPVSRRQLEFLPPRLGPRPAERRPLRRGPRAPRLGDAAARALALEHAADPARPPRRVVPIPPALPRDAARRAAARRARERGGAASARLRLVGRARGLGPGDQPRDRRRRPGPCR